MLRDRAVEVRVIEQERLASAWKSYDRVRFIFPGSDGAPVTHLREVLRVGGVAAVLPVDPERDRVVLIEQFRYPAHLATGRGELVEIVAGMIEPGEEPAHAARRECVEEIGVAPSCLIPLFPFMPAPGLVEELAHLFLAIVDSSGVPERAGASTEAEHTRPLCVPIDAALKALAAGNFVNGYCVIGLQWLALNRGRLREIIAAAAAST
jgi:ADP-ribose pyrophosphatase